MIDVVFSLADDENFWECPSVALTPFDFSPYRMLLKRDDNQVFTARSSTLMFTHVDEPLPGGGKYPAKQWNLMIEAIFSLRPDDGKPVSVSFYRDTEGLNRNIYIPVIVH